MMEPGEGKTTREGPTETDDSTESGNFSIDYITKYSDYSNNGELNDSAEIFPRSTNTTAIVYRQPANNQAGSSTKAI